ncbi:MAG: DNA polymerase I [Christensenellaceae bacterium]|jgi:DNA polymerase-1|nr:DNA polymerase I [Christensenellaceae bacterium]
MERILLLDSNSLANKAFYALPVTMMNKEGVLTNAVYGYLSMLASLINEYKPTHIGAVFDLKGPTFRHKMYDKYKATRKGMPEGLVSQMPILRDIIASMSIKILQLSGYEADDIIGTIAKRFKVETFIVSGDKDVLQLVDETTVCLNSKRGVSVINVYDLNALKQEGFTPLQIVDYKALAGDSSDNIPGVLGIGEKTAKALLSQYSSLDGIYANIDAIGGSVHDKLIEHKEDAYLSQRLATIDTNVPLNCTLEELAFSGKYQDQFGEMLRNLDMLTLAKRFNIVEKENPISKYKPVFIEISSTDKLEELFSREFKEIALCISDSINFAFDTTTEYSIKISRSLIDDGMFYDDAIDVIKKILINQNIKKLMYDVKDCMHLLSKFGTEIVAPYDDVLLKCYLSDPSRKSSDVKEILELFQLTYPATALFIINNRLEKEFEAVEKADIPNLYLNIELPLIKVLFDMEREGFSIDRDVANELGEKYTAEMKIVETNIYEIVGHAFNINSSQQLGKILFEELGLKHGKMGKQGNYSVSVDILSEIEHPIIPEILRYRQLMKLQSTYINGILSQIDRKTRKVHTIFKQCATATGRLSSTEPNLQNIPVRTDSGREIRRMFIASPNKELVFADYSQIELRLLAHFSNDPVLVNSYKCGKDIHRITASQIFNVPLDQVSKEMRRDAKAVNFGIIYGISAFGLANNIGITNRQAKEFQTRYFETYPAVKDYMDSNVKAAKRDGYIKTIIGRIRYFREFIDRSNDRGYAERAAMNMPLQGSASDIIKIAMLNTYSALKEGKLKSKLILQVHDELIIDADKDEIEMVKKLLIDSMEKAITLRVPLIADVKAGSNWAVAE